MRPAKSESRQRALGWTIAVGCAAGLSMTGCINNPTRGLSANLSKDAAQAALAAEEESTREKKEAALAQQKPKAEDPAKNKAEEVKLAGGEQVAAIRNPFAQSQANKSANDPFAELANAVENAEKPVTPLVKPQQPKPAAVPEKAVAKKPAEKPAEKKADEFDVDAWIKKELPTARQSLNEVAREPVPAVVAKPLEKQPAAAPFPGQQPPAVQNSPAAVAKAPEKKANPFAEDTVPAGNPFADNAVANQPVKEVVKKNPFADEGQPAVSPVKAAPPADTAANDDIFKSLQWSGLPAQTAAPQQEKPAVVDSTPARLKVRALISDAHSSEIRGELRNAYRSAVIASKLADEEKLSFTSDQEDPRTLAAQLSARIYTLDRKEQTSVADAQALPNSNVVDDAFRSAQEKPQSLNLRGLQETANPAKLQAAASPAPSPWPQIRPAARMDKMVWLSHPEIEAAAPGPIVARQEVQPRQIVASQPRVIAAPQPVVVQAPALSGQIEPNGGVEFAIAHTVTNADASEPVANPARHPGLAINPPAGRVAEIRSPELRGPLLAPSPDFPFATASNAPQVTWEQLNRAESPTRADANQPAIATAGSGLRWVWGLLGIISAAATATVGWKMSRKSGYEEQAPEPVVPAQPVVGAQSEAAPAFKIKRAA